MNGSDYSKALVSLLRCDTYDQRPLVSLIRQSLENIGVDIELFRNARVAVKPNLLRAAGPESAVITHPDFFRAVIAVVKSAGGIPVLVESPAFENLEKVFKKTGYLDVIRDEKIVTWNNHSTRIVRNDRGEKFKRFEIADGIFDADVIINLPKMKTHALTSITGAVKNLFGTIPGLEKSKWHMRARNSEQFAGFILDLYGAFMHGFTPPKRIINIMDGIIAMEGNGPGPSGMPRKTGYVPAGCDALAVDTVAATIMGLDPGRVLFIAMGDRRGLGAGTMEKISVSGDGIINGLTPFRMPDKVADTSLLSRIVSRSLLKNLLVERPFPSPDRCTLCYQCRRICPAGAIGTAEADEKVPHYDYNRCIRCYCCMEICPEAAIVLKKGKLQWIYDRV